MCRCCSSFCGGRCWMGGSVKRVIVCPRSEHAMSGDRSPISTRHLHLISLLFPLWHLIYEMWYGTLWLRGNDLHLLLRRLFQLFIFYTFFLFFYLSDFMCLVDFSSVGVRQSPSLALSICSQRLSVANLSGDLICPPAKFECEDWWASSDSGNFLYYTMHQWPFFDLPFPMDL